MPESTVNLEAEYDNRANVPEHPAIMAGWERDAAAFRAARASRSELSMRYGPHPRQTIDLFDPDEAGQRNAMVVFVHGGYWRSLGPELFSHFARGANAHGFAVTLPGYRLCPEVSIGEIIEDVRAACLHLHRRFGRPLVACGHSAGGHLAAALAATDWAGAAADVPATLVRRALAISGIFDLTPLLQTSVNETLRLNEGTAAELSPAFWTPPPDAVIALRAGATETPEYHRQNRTLAQRWGARGARVDTGVIAGANHFTAPAPLADPASELTRALVALCAASGSQA